jgi:hypothetical protein
MGKNVWDRGMSGNAEKATVEEEHLIWYLIWPPLNLKDFKDEF